VERTGPDVEDIARDAAAHVFRVGCELRAEGACPAELTFWRYVVGEDTAGDAQPKLDPGLFDGK
jgi:hypothetical protein